MYIGIAADHEAERTDIAILVAIGEMIPGNENAAIVIDLEIERAEIGRNRLIKIGRKTSESHQ